MAFAGTSISQGDAVAVVTSIGMSTEIGNIQRSITEAENEASDTPLKLKLDDFATKLTKVRFSHRTHDFLITILATKPPPSSRPCASRELALSAYWFGSSTTASLCHGTTLLSSRTFHFCQPSASRSRNARTTSKSRWPSLLLQYQKACLP